MITKKNISLLFNFIKQQKKAKNLFIVIKKGFFLKSKSSKLANIIIRENQLILNFKVNKTIKEILEIILPILLKNKNLCIGQIGQSIDGRIALSNGNSHYINDKKSIVYLHCLRSFCDAVVVGVNTVKKDNPKLTTRNIIGLNPIRIIIDPTLKLTNNYNIFKDGGENIIFTNSENNKLLNNSKIYKLPKKNFTKRIFLCLNKLNYKYILIEGGAKTISKCIDSKIINIMQFIISPILIGSGINSLSLKPIYNLSKALRPKNKIYKFGNEIIISLHFNS